MTVETQVAKVSAAGNDVATVFSFSPLVIFESGDLQVTHVDSDGVETSLAENTDYTVSVASYPGTGSITYPVSGTPLATGDKLVMKRVLPITQPTDLDNQGGYFPDTQEQALDRLTMICLQQQEEIDRSVKVPIGSATDPNDLVDQINTAAASASASATAAAASASAAAGSANDAAASAATAQGYAASLNLPNITGSAGRMLRVNADATGYELRSPDVVRTDIGAAGTSAANTFTAGQTIQSSDAGAAVAPTLILDRSSASPAAGDALGRLAFMGRDSGGEQKIYGSIHASITDPTNDLEDGALNFNTDIEGQIATRMSLGGGLVVGNPTGGDKGHGTLNAGEFYRNGVPLIKAGTPLVLNPYTVNTTVTQAHGLGVEPSFLRVVLECLSSEGGYSTGDRIIVSAAMEAENTSVPAFRVKANGTNLVLVTHQSGRPNIVHGSSRDNFVITAANWKLEITPYLVG